MSVFLCVMSCQSIECKLMYDVHNHEQSWKLSTYVIRQPYNVNEPIKAQLFTLYGIDDCGYLQTAYCNAKLKYTTPN